MYRPEMEKLPVYSIGAEPEWISKLDANERAVRLPQSVRRAIGRKLRGIETNRYPEMGAVGLRTMLAENYQVSLEQVVIGNGSSELIAEACAVFGGSNRSIAYQWPSFSMYPIYAALADSPSVAIPLGADFRMSAATVLKLVRDSGAKLLILCNPNNPTGTVIPAEVLRSVVEQSPCPVLLDEAYMEYCGASCIPWIKEFSHLMVARTFSKAYGLAAARIGYLLGSPEMMAVVGKRLLPYHMNSYSLALAEVCFSLREQVMKEVGNTVSRREKLFKQISRLPKVKVFPSATNFLLVRVEEPGSLQEIFIQHGVGVRNFSHVAELGGSFRITLGTASDSEKVYQCLRIYNEQQQRKENRR